MESATNTGDLVRASAIDGAASEGATASLGRAALSPASRRRARDVLRDYLALTKPRIISLLLVTTVGTMFVADPSGPALTTILWTVLGGYLAAGGAGAINHYLERERDARMDRTCARPLVEGRIEPLHGLLFGIGLGVLATLELAIAVNPLSAALALCGLLGYVFVYTLWLKPLTPQNIVIGGAAGAVPPLVGWAAATGGLTLDALYPFAIVFLWTPPHFWALSLLVKDDYGRAGIPMLPVARGEEVTRREILAYSVALVAFTVMPYLTGLFGAPYLVAAVVLGAAFIGLSADLWLRPSRAAAVRLHLASLAYLALLFCAMAADRVLG
ncbi:MAG: heme o synthase [Solirubrobacterales bacterium]